jgi:hypothetical protein
MLDAPSIERLNGPRVGGSRCVPDDAVGVLDNRTCYVCPRGARSHDAGMNECPCRAHPVRPVPTVTVAPRKERVDPEAKGLAFSATVCAPRDRFDMEVNRLEDGTLTVGRIDPSRITSYSIPPATSPRRSTP